MFFAPDEPARLTDEVRFGMRGRVRALIGATCRRKPKQIPHPNDCQQ
jgi:hypothetical protein